MKIKRALLSVSDKTGLADFARTLHDCGVELLSTGGTADFIRKAGVPVTEVADYTGFPELLDGRVKTLHPKIHAGILARRGKDDADLTTHHIPTIDLVIVNLYPFVQVTTRAAVDLSIAIENIDIGGSTLLRAAAKNYQDVTVIVEPTDYKSVAETLKAGEDIALATRFAFAKKAFSHSAAYDGAIANYLNARDHLNVPEVFPEIYHVEWRKKQTLRYGENPHQRAAFYVDTGVDKAAVDIASATQLQGKELSLNNIADADAALACVHAFSTPACVIVKHANPCGVAMGANISDAYDRAYLTDPTSAFGGIIAFNETLTADVAERIISRQFAEVIIAPNVDPDALAVLSKKAAIRVLAAGVYHGEAATGFDFKRVHGGMLIQDWDEGCIDIQALECPTIRKPTDHERENMDFAWRVARFVKSNAIVYANDQRTLGIGAGQMSRVDSARIAGIKAENANLSIQGAVMASDAFFPFRDGIDAAATAGIKAVIQPGGSMRDAEVIQAADEHGIAMLFTYMRHFKH